VEYLSGMRGASHQEEVRARLNDQHIAVRRAAAAALNSQ
jgi:hypothetical protein